MNLPKNIRQIIYNYDYSINHDNLTKLNKEFTTLFEKDQLGKVYLNKIKSILSHIKWTTDFLRRITTSNPWTIQDHDIDSNWIGHGIGRAWKRVTSKPS